MKVAFMGSDPIALPLLEELVAGHPGGAELKAVFTQPDRKTGRGMQLRPNAIKQWALEHELPVLQPSRCGDSEAAWLKEKAIDLVMVMAYGQILPASILQSAPLGVVNLHASLLPRLRGASPIHTAVALGLAESGASFMRIIPKMDAGPVADSESVAINAEMTSGDLHHKIGVACVPLIRRCLPLLADGNLFFDEQDPDAVTYCRILEKHDANLDFRVSARELHNRIRGFFPWPGTSFSFADTEIRVIESEAVSSSENAEPGTVLEPIETGLPVVCGKGTLILKKLQRPGGKPLPVDAFLRGFAIPSGSVLASREMRPLEATVPFPYRRRRKSG